MIKLIDKNRLRDDAEDAIIELLKAYIRIAPVKPVDEDLATIAKEAKTYVEGVDKKIVKKDLGNDAPTMCTARAMRGLVSSRRKIC